MGKVASISRFLRRRDFIVKFWGTFLAVLALPITILEILGTHWSLLAILGLMGSALLLSGVIHRKRLSKMHMPTVPDFFLGDETLLRCPCDHRLADQAKDLAAESYPTDMSIAPDKYELLRLKNPYILSCLTTTRGELLGYFDVIPLNEHFADLFQDGKVTETQIAPNNILGRDEIAACKYLFIAGLAVVNPDSQSGRLSASMLVWGIMKYIEHFYGSVNPIVVALASSDAGDALLQKFRFELGCEASHRIDQYRLYRLQLSPKVIAQRLACVPDWSPLCSVDWISNNRGHKPPQRHRRAALPSQKTYNLPGPLTPKTA